MSVLVDGAQRELRSLVLATLLPGFMGPDLPGWLTSLLADGLAGVCLFGHNMVDRDQTRALASAIRATRPGTIVAIDEEGGDVTRLYYSTGSPYPGNALLGRIDDLALTEQTAHWVGEELRDVGCTLAFAPDADINSDPRNPVIGVRSFGADAELVARHVGAWTRGIESTGIAASAKHFPGHGDTAADSHLGLPVIDRSLAGLRARELKPFRAAADAGGRTIMTSHILLPQIDPLRPATMSATVLGELLRGELGYTGVIVSDALDMAGASGEIGIPEAAVRALAAGVDLLCLGSANTADELDQVVTAILLALARGRLTEARVREAAARVRGLDVVVRAEGSLTDMPSYDLRRLADAFDCTAPAEPFLATPGGYAVVRIETESNVAVGTVPWGPFAAGLTADLTLTEASGDVSGELGALDRRVLVVGRDLERRPWTRAAIDRLRAERPDHVLVVDMGWPDEARRYADIATFGASRVVGQALLGLLGMFAEAAA